MSFWPGLPQLWVRGSWAACALAGMFGLLLNWLLLTTFIWPQWVDASMTLFGWALATVAWGVALVEVRLRWSRLFDGAAMHRTPEGVFEAAQHDYLRGEWFAVQSRLDELLRQNPRDMDARLLLASLFRHTGRIEEARSELAALARMEVAQKWEPEIHREYLLLERAEKVPKAADPAPDRLEAAEELPSAEVADETGGPADAIATTVPFVPSVPPDAADSLSHDAHRVRRAA